jgi:methionine-rich copper-binding protein CopC
MRIRVAAAAGLVAGCVLTVGSAPAAQAHSIPQSFSPARGAHIDASPPQVSIIFNEALDEGREELTVTGPGASTDHWNTGPATIRGAILSSRVAPLGKAGEYTMRYRVTSADGHVVTGESTFDLTRDGGGTPVAQPATASGTPVWPFLAGGAALLAVAVWVLVAQARRLR